MTEITNRSLSAEVKYTDDNYEMTGNFNQDPATDGITSLILNVNDKKGNYIGNINGYMEGGELKFSMSGIPLAEMAATATAVDNCLDEIRKQSTQD